MLKVDTYSFLTEVVEEAVEKNLNIAEHILNHFDVVPGGLEPKAGIALYKAVANAYTSGDYRAHKHNDNPSKEEINTAIVDAATNGIFEYFFDTRYDERTVL